MSRSNSDRAHMTSTPSGIPASDSRTVARTTTTLVVRRSALGDINDSPVGEPGQVACRGPSSFGISDLNGIDDSRSGQVRRQKATESSRSRFGALLHDPLDDDRLALGEGVKAPNRLQRLLAEIRTEVTIVAAGRELLDVALRESEHPVDGVRAVAIRQHGQLLALG